MANVYEICPAMENENYLLRYVLRDDCEALLKVYSDPLARPFFNSDNCHGDDFFYDTPERMKQAMDFWHYSYKEKYFVRWAIIDKKENCAVGTIELFHRDSDKDYFTDCGLLRLDLRSDFEREDIIKEILSLILPSSFELFDCKIIAAKAVPQAKERIAALKSLGFEPCGEKLIGHDDTEYGDYFVFRK